MWWYFFLSFLTVFIWEHTARKSGYHQVQPSHLLTYLTAYLQIIFHFLGASWARISSWLHTFASDIMTTMTDLAQSIWNLITSPWYFIKGYYDCIFIQLQHIPIVYIQVGGFVLLVIAYQVITYFTGSPFEWLCFVLISNDTDFTSECRNLTWFSSVYMIFIIPFFVHYLYFTFKNEQKSDELNSPSQRKEKQQQYDEEDVAMSTPRRTRRTRREQDVF
jgi:hypothetical protein